MSETLSRGLRAIGGAGTALRAVSGLFGGAFGAAGPVTLGSIQFEGHEVPQEVNWGGAQHIVQHKYPGGGRKLDIMGADDGPIGWSGTMLGADAESRAALLDRARRAGDVLDLAWGEQIRRVVIENVDLRHGFQRVEYSISCVVLPQPAAEADEGGGLLGGLEGALGAEVAGGIARGTEMARNVAGTANAALGAARRATGALGLSLPLLNKADRLLRVAGQAPAALASLDSGIAAAGRAMSGLSFANPLHLVLGGSDIAAAPRAIAAADAARAARR